MRRELLDKGMAGIGTVAFMALVKTNASPTLGQMALISIGMYEALLLAVKAARDTAKENRRRQNLVYRGRDARRWADEWFNPYKEVRS